MGGLPKDEESARAAAVAMGWVDESYHWTPENPLPAEVAGLVGLTGKVSDVHPLSWQAILDGRPWVCTEAEQRRYDEMIRGFKAFQPRHVTGLPNARP